MPKLKRVLLNGIVSASRGCLGARWGLSMWGWICHRVPYRIALPLACKVSECFPLDQKTSDLYSQASARWDRQLVFSTNPQCVYARQFSLTGIYEESLSLELLHSEEKGLLVDIGAHFGYYSALWLNLSEENTCLAIEPIPEIHSLLEKNLSKFGKRACLEAVCIGDSAGFVRMSYDPDWPMVSKVADEGREVPIVRLSEILQKHGASEIAVLKVDAEGWDIKILNSLRNLFEKRQIRKVYWESHTWDGTVSPDQDAFVAFLKDLGYLPIINTGLDMAYSFPVKIESKNRRRS